MSAQLSIRRGLIAALLLLWVGALLGALTLLWRYQSQAGESSSLKAWPAESALPPPSGAPVLLMFAHPKCPCTRASLAALRLLMSRFSGRVKAYVIFLHPGGTSADWLETDLWRDVTSLEGVTPIDDDGGREAALFDAHTSGQVYLFSGQGALLFNSGITLSRGHQGDSPTLEALIALLDGDLAPLSDPRLVEGPVYGCSLEEPP